MQNLEQGADVAAKNYIHSFALPAPIFAQSTLSLSETISGQHKALQCTVSDNASSWKYEGLATQD